MNIFELEFVDKDRKLVTTEEWLAGKEATWELKYPFLAMPILWILFIIFFPVWLIAVIILFFTDNCWHKKSLLGMLDRKTKKEQHYCSICNKIYLKKGRKS